MLIWDMIIWDMIMCVERGLIRERGSPSLQSLHLNQSSSSSSSSSVPIWNPQTRHKNAANNTPCRIKDGLLRRSRNQRPGAGHKDPHSRIKSDLEPHALIACVLKQVSDPIGFGPRNGMRADLPELRCAASWRHAEKRHFALKEDLDANGLHIDRDAKQKQVASGALGLDLGHETHESRFASVEGAPVRRIGKVILHCTCD